MGILNVTPDSFSDGGEFLDSARAVAHAEKMMEDGAALIDVGGESTRPGAQPVAADVEIERISPVIAGLARRGIPFGVDTSKAAVAEAGIETGAEYINDVTGLSTDAMKQVVSDAGCGAVIMHMKGTPPDMQAEPVYDDVVAEVGSFLEARARDAMDEGVSPTRICLDPGIGFGKSVSHNLQLLKAVPELSALGFPLMLGTSRKAFLGRLAGNGSANQRDQATATTTALGFAGGARVFRVHDVLSSRRAMAMAAAIVAPLQWDEWSQD